MTYEQNISKTLYHFESASSSDDYDDNLFQNREETDPPICPHCNLYELKDATYGETDVIVKYCKKCKYLCPYEDCYTKLPEKPKNTTMLRCPKGHELQ